MIISISGRFSSKRTTLSAFAETIIRLSLSLIQQIQHDCSPKRKNKKKNASLMMIVGPKSVTL